MPAANTVHQVGWWHHLAGAVGTKKGARVCPLLVLSCPVPPGLSRAVGRGLPRRSGPGDRRDSSLMPMFRAASPSSGLPDWCAFLGPLSRGSASLLRLRLRGTVGGAAWRLRGRLGGERGRLPGDARRSTPRSQLFTSSALPSLPLPCSLTAGWQLDFGSSNCMASDHEQHEADHLNLT